MLFRSMVAFGDDEDYRSLQIFGVDPAIMGEAAAIIAAENLADHIDINFGCPVPKVTRKGGGAALPWKTPLFRAIVAAAVATSPAPAPRRSTSRREIVRFGESGKIISRGSGPGNAPGVFGSSTRFLYPSRSHGPGDVHPRCGTNAACQALRDRRSPST